MKISLHEKCLYSEFFWSECRKIRSRKTPNTDSFYEVYASCIKYLDQSSTIIASSNKYTPNIDLVYSLSPTLKLNTKKQRWTKNQLFLKFCLFHNATIIFIRFWDFFMFYQVFLSPQVRRCAIISYKHGIYELPHELPKDSRLRS